MYTTSAASFSFFFSGDCMDKQQLRQDMRRLRRGLSLSMDDRERLISHFFDALPLKSTDLIAGYWPEAGECDVRVILGEALRRGYRCALPVVERGSRLLSFAPYGNDSAMRVGSFGIKEPVDAARLVPDVVIVPLLAFDAHGARLGQGGGYYDVTLAHLRAQKPICAVGLAYAQQECKDTPLLTEAHDQALDWIVTPQEVKSF